MALLPPMLSQLFNHSTTLTGLIMAPRGVGTMVSMLLVGRLVRMFDARVLVVTGLLLTAFSLEMMTDFTPQMDDHLIIWSGVIQGLGLGLVFVPLSTVAFATLDARFRTDATALFSLVRNIGSSIGISIVTVLLTRNIQINHTELSTAITPFNPNLQAISPDAALRQSVGAGPDGRLGQPAGGDDCLYQRFQADDAGDAGCDPPGAAVAQAEGHGRTGRRPAAAHMD